MRVVWTETAIQHLSEIYEYISRDSAIYAQRTIDRITKKSQQIEPFPESGQIVAEFNDVQIREFHAGVYRIIYRVEVEQVSVLAIVHGARQLDEKLLPPSSNDPSDR